MVFLRFGRNPRRSRDEARSRDSHKRVPIEHAPPGATVAGGRVAASDEVIVFQTFVTLARKARGLSRICRLIYSWRVG